MHKNAEKCVWEKTTPLSGKNNTPSHGGSHLRHLLLRHLYHRHFTPSNQSQSGAPHRPQRTLHMSEHCVHEFPNFPPACTMQLASLLFSFFGALDGEGKLKFHFGRTHDVFLVLARKEPPGLEQRTRATWAWRPKNTQAMRRRRSMSIPRSKRCWRMRHDEILLRSR